MSYLSKVKDELNYFLEGKEVNDHFVPKEIIDSWNRSKSYGVDPYDQNPHLLDPSQKIKPGSCLELIKKYDVFFTRITELFEFNDFVFSFADRDGINKIIINKTGHSLPDCAAHLSEKIIGTTSSALAFKGNGPRLILTPFYYRQNYMQKSFGNLHGVFAPIYDEKNELLGGLGLGFYYHEQALQAYCTVSFMAKIFNSLFIPMARGYEKQLQEILNCLPQGIVCVNEKNAVNFYNNKVLDLLEINRKFSIENQLQKHLAHLGIGVDFIDREVKIPIGRKEIEALSICSEVKDWITNQPLKLIQLDEKNSVDKYKPKSLRCDDLFTFEHIIGESSSILEAKTTAKYVAETSVPVMLYGESGTGKEMFAQAIHSASPRRYAPFIAINCGALPRELVESELFGYEEGAFTGALKGGKIGKIQAASGGTLFLDEIESMPLKDQIKLLRVLSTGKIQKIGSTREICVDIRLISATKLDLLERSAEGLFREDLFYRISTFIIELPPLRKRKEDIALLAQEFVNKFQKKYQLRHIEMDESFINTLCYYHWPGNVRELEHAIERAVIVLRGGQRLYSEHLSNKIQDAYKNKIIEEVFEQIVDNDENNQGLLALAEKKLIERVLKSVGGNISMAAERLGISRRTIYKKIDKFKLIK